MESTDNKIYNCLLQYSLTNNVDSIKISKFIEYLQRNQSMIVDKQTLCGKLALTRGFFNVKNDLIEITREFFCCADYNSKNLRCENRNCRLLHVCQNLFQNKNYCRCGLNHSMEAYFIKEKLEYRNMTLIDYGLLKSYFQKLFRNQNIRASSLISNSKNQCQNIRTESSNLSNVKSRSAKNGKEKLRVEVGLPKEFVEKYDEQLLFALLNKKNSTSDEDILSREYNSEECKAIISYKNEELAKKLIDLNEIHFVGLKITLKASLIESKSEDNEVRNEPKPRKRRLVKSLKNNTLISLILKNEQWKNNFLESLRQIDNCEIKITTNELIILTDQTRSIDDRIGKYCNLFGMKKLTISQKNYEIKKDIIKNTEEISRIYTIAYEDKNSELYLVGEKNHLDDFLSRFDVLNQLESVCSIVTESIDLPINPIHGFRGLLNLAISKLIKRFDLHDLNAEDSRINLTGIKSNVDSAINCLKKTFSSIKCKRIEAFKNYIEIINHSKNMSNILNDCLKDYETDYAFKIKIQPNISNDPNADEYGIFLFYFYNCHELDSPGDVVFESISKRLESMISFIELDVTKYDLTLNTNKWQLFEQENFKKAKCLNNFSYNLVRDQNRIKIYLAGKKSECEKARLEIENYLQTNESKTRQIDLIQDDFLFMKHVAYTDKKQLEARYGVKIEYKELNQVGFKQYCLIVNECPNNLYDEIVKAIRNICSKKIVKSAVFNSLPGSSIVYESNFNSEIEKISRETRTHIELSMSIKKNTLANKYNQKMSTNTTVSNTNGNKILRSFNVDTNWVCLEVGSIIDTEANIIVNSTSSSLNLNCGVLSKLLLKHAGYGIQQECTQAYPNGIQVGEIAVTSAGNLNQIINIFHITLSHYKDEQSCSKIVEDIVNNCLKQMSENDFKSICFPAIGTGGVGYPSSLVAKKMIETSLDFLKRTKLSSTRISIVVSEDFPQILKDFETAFINYSLANKQPDSNLIEFSYKKYPDNYFDLNLKVICTSETEFANVRETIVSMSKKYMLEDSIDYECNIPLTEVELNNCLSGFKNTEIEIQNKKIKFKGFKDEIVEAKINLLKLVGDKNKLLSEQVTLAKDIQWKYEISTGKWNDFSLESNHLIESAHLKKSYNIDFTENNVKQTIIFNSMKLCFGQSILRIQRVELKKNELVSFPLEWEYMNENEYHKLVDVNPSSSEYIKVENDFKTKLNVANLTKIRVQRIQNKTLYESYLSFKKRLKSKGSPENEMYLYHGTKNSAITQITRNGFNRSYCGINGVAYGHGVYFAVNSCYSHGYTEHTSGLSSMFRVRVLVGDCTIGNSSMKVPPAKPNGEPFDSTCDSHKSILVAYHDNQCYPEYLITYKI